METAQHSVNARHRMPGLRVDPAGCDLFAVAAFAPPGFVEDLRKVRARCPPSGTPPLDLNVTIHGPFRHLDDPAGATAAIDRAVRGLPPFTVRTTESEVVAQAGTATVIMPLEESRHLLELYGRLGEAMAPYAGGMAVAERPGQWRPHVVIVQDIPVDGVEKAIRAVVGWRVNYFWTIRDVDLVGRARGVLWQSLAKFHFGRPDA